MAERRLLTGFVVAPFGAVALVSLVLAALSPNQFGPGSLDEAWFAWAWLLPWILPIAYVAEAVVGAPLHAELKRRGNSSFWAYCLVGAITGLAPFVAYAIFPILAGGRRGSIRWSHDLRSTAIWSVIAAASGIASAALFWVVTVRATARDGK